MKKFLLSLLLLVTVTFVFASQTYAAPKLKSSQRIRVSAFRTAKEVKMTFSNLGFAKKIAYQLTYKRAGAQDGAAGTIFPTSKKAVVRSILLGTCSTGAVCTYHRNVTNVKLKVTTWYSPSLAVETKTYNIK